MEQPMGTYPQKAFASVDDGTHGLTIGNRGLPEYEALNTPDGAEIAVTLLRCVGWLSRADLTSRKGGAGPQLRTPGAQLPGRHVFEYCIIPHDGAWEPAGAHVLAVDVVLADGSVAMLGGLTPDQPGYDLRGCFVGSEGTMGVATRIAVRLTPDPPVVRTLLLDFTSIEDAAATVSGIIAAGIVPAAVEMMDAEITRAVEDFVGAGYPRDAAAVLLVELDGLEQGVEAQVEAVRAVGAAHGARSVRVAADEAERALLWKGRKSAFGAIARIAPDYYLHDAVVPRTRLVDVLRQVYAIAAEQRLTMMNVFHAGDGNLHPLIVFDAREPGIWARVHAAGDDHHALFFKLREYAVAADVEDARP